MTIARAFYFHGEYGDASEVTDYVGSASADSSDSFTGTYSLRGTGTEQFGGDLNSVGYTQMRGGFQFRHDGMPSASPSVIFYIFSLWYSGVLRVGYGIGADGFVYALDAGGNIDTGFSSYGARIGQTNRWRQYNWWFEIGGNFSLWIDGNLLYQNPIGALDPMPEQLRFGGKTGVTGGWLGFNVDDCWVDLLASESELIGPTIRFWPSAVSADGSYTAWSASAGNRYQCVDEIPANDDTDYVKSYTAEDRNSFQTATPSMDDVVENNITHVYARARARYASGAAALSIFAYENPDTADGANQDVTSAYANYFEQFDAHPDTTAWTKTSFDSCEFGVQAHDDSGAPSYTDTWKTTGYSLLTFCGEEGAAPASNAFDNNIATQWQHVADENHYITFDLGARYAVGAIRRYKISGGASNWVNAKLYITDDTSDWGPIRLTFTTSTTSGAWSEHSLATPIVGRYCKIECDDTTIAGNAIATAEIEVKV